MRVRVRGRNGIPVERWEEFWDDRQAGMKIRELVSKYSVSRGYVFSLLRRLRTELEESLA
jgi:Mor family transcriptional regulator